jgi:hypothetical protein
MDARGRGRHARLVREDGGGQLAAVGEGTQDPGPARVADERGGAGKVDVA